MTRGPRAGAGFTLVELLVALALLGLLSSLMFDGFRFGARAWERVGTHADHASDIQWAQSFLRRRLSEAASVRAAIEETTQPVLFEGTDDGLAFITVLPVYGDVGGHSVLRLDLVDDAPGRQAGGELRLGWAPHRFDAEDLGGEMVDERTLLDGVESVEVAYYGRKDDEATAASWHREWRRADYLPRLVRIRLTFTEGSGRHWPDLVVAPVTKERQRRARRARRRR